MKAPSKPAPAAEARPRGEARGEPSRSTAARDEGAGTARPSAAADGSRTSTAAPVELCAGKNFLMAIVCLKQECSKPAYAQHAKCVDFLEKERQREEREAMFR